jgi:hypothetical protein
MYGLALPAVVYIRNTLRHRGAAKPGRAKGRVVWEGEYDAADTTIIKAETPD